MSYYNNMDEKQRRMIDDFIKEAVLLSSEENAAIEHQITMTQELFEQCASDLVRIDSITGFNRLFNRFPEQAKEYDKKIEEILENIGLPVESEEEQRWRWEELCSKIREKYGDDAI